MSREIEQQVSGFLAAHHVMSLATVGSSGPHAANLFYACDGLRLIWVSDCDTRHSKQIEADSRVAVTVAPDYTDFVAIRGLQIEGRARRVDDANERMRLLAQLEARYPFLKQLSKGPAKLREAYGRTAVYLMQPSRIVLIDNSKGFGHKQTLEITSGA